MQLTKPLDSSQFFFLCKHDNSCKEPCFEDCKHTTKREQAKYLASVELMDEFLNTFNYSLDEDGRIIFWEK